MLALSMAFCSASLDSFQQILNICVFRCYQLGQINSQWHAGQVVMCPEKSYPQENKEKALLGYTSR